MSADPSIGACPICAGAMAAPNGRWCSSCGSGFPRAKKGTRSKKDATRGGRNQGGGARSSQPGPLGNNVAKVLQTDLNPGIAIIFRTLGVLTVVAGAGLIPMSYAARAGGRDNGVQFLLIGAVLVVSCSLFWVASRFEG
jgi:hypothetical protein